MLPFLAGAAARLGVSTASRSAVTSAASSGAISAGTPAVTSGSRMLSAAQFASAGARVVSPNQTAQPRQSEPARGDGLGWMRS